MSKNKIDTISCKLSSFIFPWIRVIAAREREGSEENHLLAQET